MSELELTLGRCPTGPVLTVVGDLDHASADRLRIAVDGVALQAGELLTLDLSGLDYCDSSGITALLVARNRVHARAAELAVSNVPVATARIFSLLGLDAIFPGEPAPAGLTD